MGLVSKRNGKHTYQFGKSQKVLETLADYCLSVLDVRINCPVRFHVTDSTCLCEFLFVCFALNISTLNSPPPLTYFKFCGEIHISPTSSLLILLE